MQVKKEHGSVRAGKRTQVLGCNSWVAFFAIRCFAVSDVDDNGWKTIGMRREPLLRYPACLLKSGGHWRPAIRNCVKPDRKFYFLFDQAAGTVGNLFHSRLYTCGHSPDFADGNELFA